MSSAVIAAAPVGDAGSFAGVEARLAGYCAALGREDGSAAAFRAGCWLGRQHDDGGGLQAVAEGEGPLAGWAAQAAPTSLQLFHGDFAVARIDDWAGPRTAFLLLFHVGGEWRVAGEAAVSGARCGREAAMSPATSEREVLDTLHGYYRAVEQGDDAALSTLFDSAWQMTNHRLDRSLAAEDRATFQARIGGKPVAGYGDDRQVADVQIAFDQLAYVRIDKPSSAVTTTFLLMRAGERWAIVDKAWSNGTGE